MTVTGITGSIEVGAVGPVNERGTYAAKGVTGMVSAEFGIARASGGCAVRSGPRLVDYWLTFPYNGTEGGSSSNDE